MGKSYLLAERKDGGAIDMNTIADLKNMKGSKTESTEIGLFVRTSDEELKKRDKQRIYDALVRETDINEETARIVAREVEKMVSKMDVEYIPPL